MFEIIISIIFILIIFFGAPIALMYGVNLYLNRNEKRCKIDVSYKKEDINENGPIKSTSIDQSVKWIYIIILLFSSSNYRPENSSTLHSVEELTLVLIIMWLLLFFGIYKIALFDNETIKTYRLVKDKSILVEDILIITQTLRYYKVVHKNGVFRFSDLLTGSTGFVNSLIQINPRIEYRKFELKDIGKSPYGFSIIFHLISIGLGFIGIIAYIIWQNTK